MNDQIVRYVVTFNYDDDPGYEQFSTKAELDSWIEENHDDDDYSNIVIFKVSDVVAKYNQKKTYVIKFHEITFEAFPNEAEDVAYDVVQNLDDDNYEIAEL